MHIKYKDILSLAALTFLLRLATFYTPILDVDESFFGVFASVLQHGGVPYLDAMDNKPPLIFFLYQAVWAVFGENNWLALHILTAICVVATAIVIGRIGSSLVNEQAGRIAMFFYAVITTLGEPKLIAANINIFMMLPASACFLAFASAVKKEARWKWLLCGAFAAITALFRYQGAMIAVVIAVCALIEDSSPKILLRRMALFTVGGLAVTALVIGYIHHIGALDAYILSFKAGMVYSGQAGSFAFWPRFLHKSGLFLLAALPFVALLLSGVAAFRLRQNVLNWRGLRHHCFDGQVKAATPNASNIYLLIWFILSWVPVCYGRRFYGHYYIQLMPSLALLAACGFSYMQLAQPKGCYSKSFTAAICLWALFFFLIRFENTGIRQLIGIHPSDWVEISGLECPVGRYIKERTNGTDRIFVWGSASPIYTCAERLPASRFMWLDMLVGRISAGKRYRTVSAEEKASPLAPELWKILFTELEKHRPVYIVDTSTSESFGGYQDYPLKSYPINDWMKANGYKFEATVSGAELFRGKQ